MSDNIMSFKEIKESVKIVVDFIGDTERHPLDAETKSLLDSISAMVVNNEDLRNTITDTILIEMCDRSMESNDKFERVKSVFMYMDIRLHEVEPSQELLRRCMITNNIPMIQYLTVNNCRFKINGNIVRQAVYANKLDMATMLLNYGYPAPEKITIFSVANQLSWDPNRLKFLLACGTRLVLEDKEKECISLIAQNSKIMEDTNE